MPSPFPLPPASAFQVEQCRQLVFAAAVKFNIAPAYITAHVRSVPADTARREVMVAMIALGLRRAQVARAFGRHHRRVRRSVLGA